MKPREAEVARPLLPSGDGGMTAADVGGEDDDTIVRSPSFACVDIDVAWVAAALHVERLLEVAP